MGFKWVGVELEQKFVDLAKQNFHLLAPFGELPGYPLPVIIQGDSRRLSEIIGQADCAVMSPPYAGTELQGGPTKNGQGYTAGKRCFNDYGAETGQIGAMKAGSVDAVCTSPPYAESLSNPSDKMEFTGAGGPIHPRNYANNPSNIGNLKAGDVGAVCDGIVTSPPYESTNVVGCDQIAPWIRQEYRKTGKWPKCGLNTNANGLDYIGSEGQIGQTGGETYWQAVSDVYRECHKILKPQGVMVIVVKSYVKQGHSVPLPMQTLKLLIHLGFTPLERIKAMQVKEEIHQGLFGEIKKRTERKSFFRRLAEKKGSPKIDWEEILICRKDKNDLHRIAMNGGQDQPVRD